ncbi:MAG TPA: peptide ABC transporter permease [Deltaproteobacteria bacterium]|nr:peptide ABC transporter permease [Deltaproteobacteria bacterium]
MQIKNFKLIFGGGLVVFMVLLALLAPILPVPSPEVSDMAGELRGPSAAHWLGQDEEGRDVLSRVVFGARLSLLIGFTTVALSMSLGTIVGLGAGYFGGKVDAAFVFLSDLFMAFPSILLIIALAAFMPPSILNIILVLSVVGWVSYARLVRGQVLALRQVEYVQAAQSLGFSSPRILSRHIFPNVLGPVIVNATLSIAGVIIAETTLSFLGLGVSPGTPSWGAMLDAGVAYLLIAPHLSIVPGIAIMLAVLGFNFLGDGLRDKYDVRSGREA